jgi:hypothetical protein
MYPDNEHFYYDDQESFCPKIHKDLFMECLNKAKVESSDTMNSGYLKCVEEQKIHFQKCLQENGTEFILERHLTKTMPVKCDKQNKVYKLVVYKIANSNLILLKTNRLCSQQYAVDIDFGDVPTEVLKYYEKNSSLFCYKQGKPQLFRSRPKSCVSSHIKVKSKHIFVIVITLLKLKFLVNFFSFSIGTEI